MLEINSAILGKSGRYKITKSGSFCSKHKTQINNPNSQPCILYSGLHSLNKSIFPMMKMSRCVLLSQKGRHKSDILFSAFPEGHHSKSTNTTKPLSTFPSTHDAIYCFLLLFHFAFLTWQLSCHFELLGYQLHNCHQHGLSSWFLKILPMEKKRLPLVSLVYFTFIFLAPFFSASGPEVLPVYIRNKMSTKRALIQQDLSSMTHHISKGFNPKRAKGKKMLWKRIVRQ